MQKIENLIKKRGKKWILGNGNKAQTLSISNQQKCFVLHFTDTFN